MQPTDDEGVVAFDTLFPGHYEGRATHTHIIANQNGTVLPNSTYSGGVISHVGQLFWDESLRALVETAAPYNTNTQAVTSNVDDMWAPEQADNNYDPFPSYVYLGDDITDGLLAWISIGIDMSSNYTVSAAGKLTANGGVAASNPLQSGAGMNGSMPSGATSSSAIPTS
jgi:hypothetical protein